MTYLKKNYPRKSSDVPAAKAQLYLVRDGLEFTAQKNHRVLKSDIAALRNEVRADITALRIELKSDIVALRNEVQADIAALRSEVQADIAVLRKELKADIKRVEDQILDLKDFVKSEMHQMKLLIEEQNARNIFVLDGLSSLFDRQDRLEKRVEKLEKDI